MYRLCSLYRLYYHNIYKINYICYIIAVCSSDLLQHKRSNKDCL